MSSDIGDRIVKNISILFSAQVITWVSSFVLLYFLPRYLGSADYGRLYLALSIKMMLGLMIDFGGNYLIPKEVARAEIRGIRILNSYLLLRVILWVIAMGLFMLLSNLLGYSEHVYLLILILAIGKLWEGGTSAINAYFEGKEQMFYPSLGGIIERLFVALFAVAALLAGADSIAIAIIMSVGGLLNLLVILWFARPHVKLKPRFDYRITPLLSSGMPFFLFSLFSVIYYRIDAVMISAYTTETVTGWYGGAYRFFDVVMVLPLIYKTAIFPVFSKLWNNRDGMLESTVGESVRLMILLGFPTAIGIFLFAEPIIHFFMGLDEYGPSVIILKIFALSIPIIFIDIILGSALMSAANRQKAWAVVGLLAIGVNIIANMILIPHTQLYYLNGGIGAAIATFITELFVMVVALYLLPRHYLKTFKSAHIWKPAMATLIMAGFLWILTQTGIYWMIAMLFGPVVYTGCLLLFGTFSSEEIKMIKSYSISDQIRSFIPGRQHS